MEKIELTAWNNGVWREEDGSFGFRIYKKNWELFSKVKTVKLELPTPDGKSSQVINIELSDSFPRLVNKEYIGKCPEIRDREGRTEIQHWMLERGDIPPSGRPWPKEHPPKYKAEIKDNHVRVTANV